MSSRRRRTKRIDYAVLHKTGEKVAKLSNIEDPNSDSEIDSTGSISSIDSESSGVTFHDANSSKVDQNIIELTSLFESTTMTTKAEVVVLTKSNSVLQQTIADDIDDYIEENPSDFADIDEVDEIIKKMEEYRTSYRSCHNELKQQACDFYEEMFEKDYTVRLRAIKSYILLAKNTKKKLKADETALEVVDKSSKRRSCNFLITEINSLLIQLKNEFGKSTININDDEIARRKCELPDLEKQMGVLSKLIKDLLNVSLIGDKDVDDIIKDITVTYADLCTERDTYVEHVKHEIHSRELGKEDLFREGKLKIHLSKFSGYDSKQDYYSFKSDFLKLCERTTPKRLQAELIKNNYLEGPALSLVNSLDDIEAIWERLKSAYGDTKFLLKKKLNEVDKINLWKYRSNPEKLVSSLSSLINILKDVTKLAEDHDIETKLYCGDGLDRIYTLLGDNRLTKWLFHISKKVLTDKQLWNQLIEFLDKDLKVQQQKVTIQINRDDSKANSYDASRGGRDKQTQDRSSHSNSTDASKGGRDKQNQDGSSHFSSDQCSSCSFCDGTDHVATNGPKGTKLIQYFACQKFAEMTPNERFLTLKRKGYCIQCLFPGAQQNEGRHQEGKCQRDFTCTHSSHDRYPVKKHVLICHEHRETVENQQLLETFKQRCINKRAELPPFSRDIKLSFHVTSYKNSNDHIQSPKSNDDVDEKAIFMLQTIKVDEKLYTVFYDSGCSEMVCRYGAINRIASRAKQEVNGPLWLSGVGNSQSVSKHGVYQVNLPLFNGTSVKFSGLCLEEITMKFPKYQLKGQVENDIQQAFQTSNINAKLPDLPVSVGGYETDFMIGIKYLRYHPEKVFSLPSGLTIYESCFCNPDGSRGVIGGPHKVFTEIEANYPVKSFMSMQYELFKNGYQVNPDLSILSFRSVKDNLQEVVLGGESIITDSGNQSYASQREKMFQTVEDAGSEILYRCIDCRSCEICKEHKEIENVSLKEEVEQDLINRSVTVDVENKITVASLPFIENPSVKLSSNKQLAHQVYNQQLKKLNKSPQDKQNVIESEDTLQKLGFVDYVYNLSKEDQELLEKSELKYYLPWRVVWKDSVSTPVRPVFDASMKCSSGYSLNDVLAKGKNNMNKLLELVIRWYGHYTAFHTDIRKMYNTIQLRKEDWTFQRYIWQSELDPTKLPSEKIVKTIIYGVRPSGNQAERGLRQTAKLSEDEYPNVNRIVQEDTYVDDCLTGEVSYEKAVNLADDLELVLNRGGFSLKGVAFSGKAPPKHLSSDGNSINVAGMKWYPLEDTVSLDISTLNFSKKIRGKKSSNHNDIIPDHITRRHCVSKTAEIFDITGKITPITATMKMDLHELVIRQLDWDDRIPDDLRPLWCSHFDMMKEISNIRFKRAVIPEDAASLNLETLDFGDASKKLCCVAIYARFLRKNGEFSSQLVFARSKIIPTGMSQPRAELFAAAINTHTGEVARKSFGEFHKGSIKVTDSQVVLYWLHNDDKPLKQWVRNRIVDIPRFTKLEI